MSLPKAAKYERCRRIRNRYLLRDYMVADYIFRGVEERRRRMRESDAWGIFFLGMLFGYVIGMVVSYLLKGGGV
jgi:hypothetical protein